MNIAHGDHGDRAAVETVLSNLEQKGFRLTETVQAIWAGQRDPVALTADLDDLDTRLVQRILEFVEQQS